jgi:hypothetical protein
MWQQSSATKQIVVVIDILLNIIFLWCLLVLQRKVGCGNSLLQPKKINALNYMIQTIHIRCRFIHIIVHKANIHQMELKYNLAIVQHSECAHRL